MILNNLLFVQVTKTCNKTNPFSTTQNQQSLIQQSRLGALLLKSKTTGEEII